MLGNFQYLQTDLSTDHNFTGNTATSGDGYHKIIHFVNQGSDPSVVTNIGQLYTKTVGATQQLFYENGLGQVSQISATATSATAKGTASLLGGMIIQWGTVTLGATTSGSVTFNIAFPNNLFSLTNGLIRAGAGTAQSVNMNTPTVSGFNWTSTSVNNISFYWMAIGN
jgi:hypothetical protein